MEGAPTHEDLLRVALGAARLAGVIMCAQTGLIAPEEKGGQSDLVTAADRECQEVIKRAIHSEFPAHRVLGEEDVPPGAEAASAALAEALKENHASGGFLYLVDPIDGTTNFASGLPFCCTSIAVVQGGIPVVGVVYDPARGEAFTAVRGRGAHLNGTPIHAGRAHALREAVVGFGGLGRKPSLSEPTHRVIAALSGRCRAVRGLGSAALHLAYVASGRLDAAFDLSLNAWDTAAGALIVEEAGGEITNFAGERFSLYTRDVLASSNRGQVHQDLRDIFKEVGALPQV